MYYYFLCSYISHTRNYATNQQTATCKRKYPAQTTSKQTPEYTSIKCSKYSTGKFCFYTDNWCSNTSMYIEIEYCFSKLNFFFSLQSSMGGKPTAKIRTKTPAIRTSPAPKADAANQTQIKPYTNLQSHHLVSTNK